MYGTREELCVQLEKMFTFDEPLVLLIWTEEGISVACREAQPKPDGAEIRAVMKALGEMKMTQYRQEGVTNLAISDLLTRQREAANRQVSVPAALLSASCVTMSVSWSIGPEWPGKLAGLNRTL